MPSYVRERSSEPLPAFQPRPPSCRFHSWLIARQNGKQLRGQKNDENFAGNHVPVLALWPQIFLPGVLLVTLALLHNEAEKKNFTFQTCQHLRIPHSVLDKVICSPWEALLSQKLSPDLSLFQDDHCSVGFSEGFSLSFHSFCQPRQRNISQGHEGMTKHNKSFAFRNVLQTKSHPAQNITKCCTSPTLKSMDESTAVFSLFATSMPKVLRLFHRLTCITTSPHSR